MTIKFLFSSYPFQKGFAGAIAPLRPLTHPIFDGPSAHADAAATTLSYNDSTCRGARKALTLTKRTPKPHQTKVSPEQLEWLRAAVESKRPFREMASYMKVCIDTLKRILHRHALMEFDGAKYALAIPVLTWNKPCLRCGDTATRPKNLYYCSAHSPQSSGLSQEWDDF